MQSRQVFHKITGNKEGVTLLVKEEVTPPAEVSEKMKLLVEEFKGVVNAELSEGLLPMKNIQLYIDLISREDLPNLSHYRINLKKSKVLKDEDAEKIWGKCSMWQPVKLFHIMDDFLLNKMGYMFLKIVEQI